MTDFTSQAGRYRDQQDAAERGLWGEQTYVVGAGSHMTVRGTGTLDEEVPVLQVGYGFNLPRDSEAEVVMLSLGSDPNAKVALPTIPRDKQHQWGEGQGGVQHPTDPNRRLEFNDDGLWLKDGTYVLGHDKAVTITVVGSEVTINLTGAATLKAAGALAIEATDIALTSATLTHNGKDIGDTHRHIGVQTGSGITGVPQ